MHRNKKKKVKSLFKHPYVLNEVIIIKSYYYILHTGLNSFQGLVFLIEFSIYIFSGYIVYTIWFTSNK